MAFSSASFDLITTRENKMKGISVYEKYLDDFRQENDHQAVQVFERMKKEDEEHVHQLRDVLQRHLQAGKFR